MEYYIKKNDVVSLLMKEAKSHGLSFSAEAYERAANIMACMPNEDVQPVKHGKWEHVAGMNSKCSICSHYFPVSEFNSRPFDINFCPACGARMDGETNG